MGGSLDFRELFLSGDGRIARSAFWLGTIVVLVLLLLYEALIEDFVAHLLTGAIVYPTLFYCGACVLSKRLHDRGRTGWWAAPILVSTVAVWPHPIGFFDFPFFLVVLWAFVELALMPGEMGANRFGPNPLRPATA